MMNNLERFQMTKLRPFREKLQKLYISTNVSLSNYMQNHLAVVEEMERLYSLMGCGQRVYRHRMSSLIFCSIFQHL